MYECARNKCGGVSICGMAMTSEMEHVEVILKKKKKKKKEEEEMEVKEEIAFDITNCPCS
jgi:hypothetical protein